MPSRLIHAIDTRDFGSLTHRVGDLNADGLPDLLLIQSIHATREIACLTAITLAGDILWQHGKPSADHALCYSDLPVQIHDFDNDGQTEVLYVSQANYTQPILTRDWARERAAVYTGQATLHILDAATGKEKSSFPIPAPADDTLLFADLTDHGHPSDLIVKDRYWNLWGISHAGQTLFHWQGPTGHAPAIGDVDNDGCDEIFTGYALIDHTGQPVFTRPSKPTGDGGEHADACVILQLPDQSTRLVYGNGGLHCLTPQGEELWSANLPEAQHVTAGHFLKGEPNPQIAAINRGQKRTPDDVASLHLFDMTGRELWQKTCPPGSWAAQGTRLNWTGQSDSLLVGRTGPGRPALIYDSQGQLIDELEMTFPPRPASSSPAGNTTPVQYASAMAFPADLLGDSRDEVILLTPTAINIHTNRAPLTDKRLHNATHYVG